MISAIRVIQYAAVMAVFTVLGGCSGGEEPGAEHTVVTGQTASDSPLVLRIAFTSYTFGMEELPGMAVTIHNSSDDFVWLTRPGDGSTVGWRTPLLNWSALPVNSDTEAPDQEIVVPPKQLEALTGWCRTRSKPRKVFRVAPGGTVQLSGWLGRPYFPKPGRYRVKFHYENNPDMLWDTGGGLDDQTIANIKRSDRCSLVSNEVWVTVTP